MAVVYQEIILNMPVSKCWLSKLDFISRSWNVDLPIKINEINELVHVKRWVVTFVVVILKALSLQFCFHSSLKILN